jgi:hypothetical protein
MENLTLEGSAKTPTINFDATSGKLELRGRSIPENSVEFYKPLNEWIENYGSSPASETSVDMKLEYFNTSSSKCILDLFKKLEAISGGKTTVTVNWFFEEDDEDMEEAGQYYKAMIGLPFNIIEVEEI